MTNIMIDREVLNAFPLQYLQTRQEYLLFPLLFNIVLDALARATKQEKQIKGWNLQRKKLKFPYLQIV